MYNKTKGGEPHEENDRCFSDAAALKLAVASDLHYNLPEETLTWLTDDPVFGYANRRAAMENESGFLIDAFLADCEKQGADYVLLSGDLADNGRSLPEEHYAVRDKLLRFEQRTGIEVFVIDGNHDLGDGSATDIADFKEIYRELGYDHALTVREDDCSYTADLGDSLRLIALDSCDPTKSTEDGMTLDKLRFVHTEAAKAKKDGRYPIVMMHHNLLDHMPMQRVVSRNFIVRFHRTTAELFADWGVRVVFSGHEHCGDATAFTSALGNKIYDFAVTSLTMYPLSYLTLSFTDDAIRYEAVPVERIDTDALTAAVRGYTDAQIRAMNDDLNAYAKGFLKKGVEYRLWLSLTMEKMGIKESDFYYGAAYAVFSRLNELLAMPLYGENSVQALGKAYSIDIPDSDYRNAWDLATELVSMHYAGGEHFALDSTEVTLLLRAVNLILHDDLTKFNDKVLLGGANRLLGKTDAGIAEELTKLGCKAFGAVTPGEFFLLALLSPFLYEFAFDADGVDDNHGTIEGYGVQNNARNAAAKAQSFFTVLRVWFENLLLIVTRVLRLH